MSFRYLAYGEVLDSTIEIPELRCTSGGAGRWEFEVVDTLPEARDRQLLGEESIYGAVSARLVRHSRGYRIEIDDTGAFDIGPHNREIRWRPNEEPWWDFGRLHLIGRVLGTSLQLDGVTTLHASAVRLRDGVVGFLAPKGFGKSTLALALYEAGAKFVTDDALPLHVEGSADVSAADAAGPRGRPDRTDGAVTALPGIQSLRVHAAEAKPLARRLGLQDVPSPGRDRKVFLPPFPRERCVNCPTNVAALYFLQPVRPGEGSAPVARVRVSSARAAVGLVGQTKIGRMLGGSFAAENLERMGDVVASVPVYTLEVARGKEHLSAVVSGLVGWHGLPREAGVDPGAEIVD